MMSSVKSPPVSYPRLWLQTCGMLLLFNLGLWLFRKAVSPSPTLSLDKLLAFLKGGELSTGLMMDVGFFILMVVILHLVWALVIVLSFRPWMQISDNALRTSLWLLLVLIHLTAVLVLNSYFTPTSLYGFFRDTPLMHPILVALVASAPLLVAIFAMMQWSKLGFYTLLVGLSLWQGLWTLSHQPQLQQRQSDPNIIIIGIDGLRPDHLASFGSAKALTPNLDQFLASSQVYPNTYTPIARTYAAWFSLLRGQYPRHHGVRFNLAPPELTGTELPLLERLAERGYWRVFALDERRFNHIDERFGFDAVVGPKAGAADTLITTNGDNPLVNLTLQWRWSQYLFPYLYDNRSYGKAYQPARFNQAVVDASAMDRPNLVSAHFCLLHWPYSSQDFIDLPAEDWQGNYYHFMYLAMLKKVDAQFGNLMAQLKQAGLLDNAMVFVMSDHGEGLGLSGDGLSASHQQTLPFSVNSLGHGTNLLVQAQSKVLLAYQRYNHGLSRYPRVWHPGLHSLVDIAATVDSALELNLANLDGKPLPHDIAAIDERAVFVESALPLREFDGSQIDEAKVFSKVASLYQVRSDGRAVIRPERYRELNLRKQRSVYLGQWQLLMLPRHDDLVLVDLDKNQWFNLSSYQGDAPITELKRRLCRFYGGDYGFDHLGACNGVQYAQHSGLAPE